MELNNSNAASAFFAFLPFYSFTFKKGYRIFHFSFFPFPLNAASAFFTFLPFYFFTFSTPISLSRRSACPQRSMR